MNKVITKELIEEVIAQLKAEVKDEPTSAILNKLILCGKLRDLPDAVSEKA